MTKPSKRKVIATHETSDDFTERHLEVVRYTDHNGDMYWLNIQEVFEKDSNGDTESLASINLTHTEMVQLYLLLQESVYGHTNRMLALPIIQKMDTVSQVNRKHPTTISGKPVEQPKTMDTNETP